MARVRQGWSLAWPLGSVAAGARGECGPSGVVRVGPPRQLVSRFRSGQGVVFRRGERAYTFASCALRNLADRRASSNSGWSTMRCWGARFP